MCKALQDFFQLLLSPIALMLMGLDTYGAYRNPRVKATIYQNLVVC
nr:hypothetical protein [Butyrivibrio sp. AE3009]